MGMKRSGKLSALNQSRKKYPVGVTVSLVENDLRSNASGILGIILPKTRNYK